MQGTVNLVREAQSSGIQRIVLLSTLPTDDPPLSNQPEEFNIMSVFSPDRLMQGLMYAVDQLNKGWPMTDRYAVRSFKGKNASWTNICGDMLTVHDTSRTSLKLQPHLLTYIFSDGQKTRQSNLAFMTGTYMRKRTKALQVVCSQHSQS